MRRLFVVPLGLFVLMLGGFIFGFAGQLPLIVLLSTICATPMFLIAIGFAFGKASNRYSFFVPKEVVQSTPVNMSTRQRRIATPSQYDASVGDLRGN